MFKMFNQFFAMLATLFAAGEKVAKAADHLATWSEETAASFSDEARIQRKAKLKALYQSTGVIVTEDGRIVDPEYQRMVDSQSVTATATRALEPVTATAGKAKREAVPA